MKKGIDYSLEETKIVAIINAIILKAKNMKEKAGMDNDCRTVIALCGEVVKIKAVLDKYLIEENEKLRKIIYDHFSKSGFDDHGINELLISTYKVKLYTANNYKLRLIVRDFKKQKAQAEQDALKRKPKQKPKDEK